MQRRNWWSSTQAGGVDLRVEAFLAEGVDPVRAVFLLRLYDGTFDHRLRDWQAAIEDEEFYEGVLEPVVNRQSANPSEMELVIEGGLSLLEERQEQARRERPSRTCCGGPGVRLPTRVRKRTGPRSAMSDR